MENAKKMIIVSPEVLQRIQNTQTPTVSSSVNKLPGDTVSELDREMSRLLNNKTLSDQDKWEQYQQVLQRYLHFASQKRKPLQFPIVNMDVDASVGGDGDDSSDAVSSEEIVETFTKTYKQDARNLLKALRGKKDLISWDSDGVVYIRKEKIPNSNIIDLMHDIIRVRKSIQPPGWKELIHLLKEINIPNEFVTNPFSREYLMSIKGTTSSPNTTSTVNLNRSSDKGGGGGESFVKRERFGYSYTPSPSPPFTRAGNTKRSSSRAGTASADDTYPAAAAAATSLIKNTSSKRKVKPTTTSAGATTPTPLVWEKFNL